VAPSSSQGRLRPVGYYGWQQAEEALGCFSIKIAQSRFMQYKTIAMSTTQTPLREIVAELKGAGPIERPTILRWMRTDDIEAMGALMSLLAENKHFDRIDPPLSLEEYCRFAADYYERALAENPDGEWSDSRTTAGWDFAKWFLQLWQEQQPAERMILADLKMRLAKLCKVGGPSLCNALVTAVLEHLFERSEVQQYFRDWLEDPMLRDAYTEAKLLADTKARVKN
jgi:hypothetical protein